MGTFRRREFLKLLGLAGSASLASCSAEPTRRLIPYIVPHRDVIPGVATWYASTCLECPSGCGILARNRDGRVVKLEGNPLHPVNRGALCARGQAALQGLYDPDRLKAPRIRLPKGEFFTLPWHQAESTAWSYLGEKLKRGEGKKVLVISSLMTGAMGSLLQDCVDLLSLGGLYTYEPLSYESLARASQRVFGDYSVPHYRLDQADLIISFGADFLGTWISPVEYSWRFAEFRTGGGGKRGQFIYIGPRLSQTGANADRWIGVRPGLQSLVALALLKRVWQKLERETQGLRGKSDLKGFLSLWDESWLVENASFPRGELELLERLFVQAQRPLVLASGLEPLDPHSFETSWLSHVLTGLKPESRKLLDVKRGWSLARVTPKEEIQGLLDRIKGGAADLILIIGANPAYSLPEWDFPDMDVGEKVRMIAISPWDDETASLSWLVLPCSTFLEDWGYWEPREGIRGLIQPVMGRLWDTKSAGDILMRMLRMVLGKDPFPGMEFRDYLLTRWAELKGLELGDPEFQGWWNQSLAQGGLWEDLGRPVPPRTVDVTPPEHWELKPVIREVELIAYPTIQFLDGRSANRPWLQELPDPMTQVTWGAWVEINQEEAEGIGVHDGDIIRIKGPRGEALELPAYITRGVVRNAVAVPLGQGHGAMGRYAKGVGDNPWKLFGGRERHRSGGWPVSLESTDLKQPLAHTDGSISQHGRGLAQAMGFREWEERSSSGKGPKLRLPLPEFYDPKEDFYPPHGHSHYRWSMVVDLDRCIGCGACVIACNAENNVAIVGRRLVLQGREMHWLRIERYWEDKQPWVRFLPMLCQHCDCAPCESVCPVYAPHHSPEGLNNQVYNRCIGTRFCSQNCPYKVRRFNWFTFKRPEPLNMQLNPDVTVRQKGVMEKCSFCVQRIVEAKDKARREKRMLKDGDVTPACVQTCPTKALVFGNLMDKDSRVARLARDVRAYQILAHLNTKPAVIYLKRIITDI